MSQRKNFPKCQVYVRIVTSSKPPRKPGNSQYYEAKSKERETDQKTPNLTDIFLNNFLLQIYNNFTLEVLMKHHNVKLIDFSARMALA